MIEINTAAGMRVADEVLVAGWRNRHRKESGAVTNSWAAWTVFEEFLH